MEAGASTSEPRGVTRPRFSAAAVDAALAVGLAIAAAVLYGTTSHADWIFDSLRYADFTQRDALPRLLLLLHALGNLVPLLAFRGFEGVGYDGGSLPVLEAVAVAGAACAVALLFVAARRLGVSRPAALAGCALFAVTLGAWRGAGSAGVYGVTFAALALAWLAAVHYAAMPTLRRAALLGAAAGLALATHLAAITFVPVALLLVAMAPSGSSPRERIVGIAAAAGAAAAVAGVVLLLTAGLATDWSAEGMRRWFLGPHVPEADPSRTVGFGFHGLRSAIASGVGGSDLPGPVSEHPGTVALIATLALLALAAFGVLACRSIALRTALLAGVGLAVFAAGWYQAERPDYFSLALVPLALLWALAIDGLAARLPRLAAGWVAAGVALWVVVPLAVWNLEGEVRQTLDRAQQREAAARLITGRVPFDARAVLSPQIAPRIAYAGVDASTGWAALLEAVQDGAPRPGLAALLAERGGELYVSTRAFELTPAQSEFLGATQEEIWRRLEACCRVEPVVPFATDAGVETLYRIGERGRASG